MTDDEDEPIAYQVWLCSRCNSETVELNNHNHQCETCGALYDHCGVFIPDSEDD